ncbi:MAG: hypothetical protein QMD77_03590 [Patescibacteria group bacterium]|nr:hypothetical protein [Patescibacteria group bacterium]
MRKIKNKIKGIKKKITKKPEETVFALLVAFALVFAGMCFGTVKRDIQRENPAAKMKSLSQFEKRVGVMVSDSPMEKMAPYIARQNEKTAAYLVAIAKKESDWGKYSPKKRGKECFNYWGYKGKRNRNAAGYSCFDSPAQAVNIVGKRISNLIAKKIDTPREMVVWKCGSACTARSNADAAKWVSDVDMYYKKVYN